jgi:hypothetical protein
MQYLLLKATPLLLELGAPAVHYNDNFTLGLFGP